MDGKLGFWSIVFLNWLIVFDVTLVFVCLFLEVCVGSRFLEETCFTKSETFYHSLTPAHGGFL